MASAPLYYTYAAVMVAALVCFGKAFQHRRHTPTHKRWAVTGVAFALGGVAVVLLATYAFGWIVEKRYPVVVTWHRRLALVATAWIVLTAVTGALRMRIHTRLYVVLFPLYTLTVILALVGYTP